jgi:hypothetical protein
MMAEAYKIAFKEFQESFLKDNISSNIQDKENLFKIFYQQWPQYVDPIILLIRFYRINKYHHKASQWIAKIDKKDFLIGNIYEERLCVNEFLFERIFDEHIYKKNLMTGAKYAIQYLNMKDSCNIPFIYTNFYFFSHKIPGKSDWLVFAKSGNPDNYTNEHLFSSSISFYPPENILCIRHVNYIYDDLTQGIQSVPENTYISRNLIHWLGSNRNEFAVENFSQASVASRCFGLEDIRLIQAPNGQCEFWATQQEWSGDGINRIVRGNLVLDNILNNRPIFTNLQILHPPDDSICEKNWIPFYNGRHKLQIIYKWWPFQVGQISPDNKLSVMYSQENLPEIFRHMRGSSCLVKYNSPDKYCCVTHLSLDSGNELRRYFHFLVFFILKDDKLTVTHFTEPFYFPEKNESTHTIQYCIGFSLRPDGLDLMAQFWYSSMDNVSGFVECPMKFFESILHSASQ